MEKNYLRIFNRMLIFTSVFALYYILFLNQAFKSHGLLGNFPSDQHFHLDLSSDIYHYGWSAIKKNFEPLLHITIAFFSLIIRLFSYTRTDLFVFANASALVLALAKLFQFVIIKKLVDLNTQLNEPERLYFTIIINFCSALIILFVTTNTYLVFGSSNTLHNPTLIFLTPFATAFFYIYIKLYLMEIELPKNFKISVGLSFLLIFATLAKPAFTNIILIMMFLFYLCNPKKFFSKNFLHDLVIFVPSCLVICIQIYIMSIYNKNIYGGLMFAPFKVIDFYAGSKHHRIMPFFQALEFPLLITLFCSLIEKNYSRQYLWCAWLFTIISYAFFAFFSVKGPYWRDANLIWSCNLSLTLLYTFVIIDFGNFLMNKSNINYKFKFLNKPLVKKCIIYICAINLSLIFISGLYRFLMVFLGGHYY